MNSCAFIADQIMSHLSSRTISCDDCVFLKDTKGIYISCNIQVAKLAGLNNVNDIKGKTDFDLPWRRHAEGILQIDKMVVTRKEVMFFEEYMDDSNANRLCYLTTKIPIYFDKYNGNVFGVLGISSLLKNQIDITNIINYSFRVKEAT